MVALILVIVLGLIFVPGMWIKHVMKRHAIDRPDYPGTGAELARHLLDRAGLDEVIVEVTPAGDHYSPVDKAVRLSEANHDGRSLTAVAVATHEVAHAMQDAEGYGPLKWRTRMAGSVHTIQRLGSCYFAGDTVHRHFDQGTFGDTSGDRGRDRFHGNKCGCARRYTAGRA